MDEATNKAGQINRVVTFISFISGESEYEEFEVGRSGVTEISITWKGNSSTGALDVPYVQVWKGDTCFAEFCQHNIIGVYCE